MRMTSRFFTHCLTRPAVQVAAGILVFCSQVAVGQQPPTQSGDAKKAPTAQTHPNNPEMWNIEAMMEEAVTQIARRYNLSEPQENYTRLLLKKRTIAFLEVNEKDVRELLKESIDLRTGTKPPSFEAYMKWAVRAAPIYAEASKAIIEGNDEWRAILNDEQKKTHDADLSLMRTNFDQVGKTMEEWQKGNTPVGRAPGTAPGEGGPGVVGNPQQGQKLIVPPAIVRREPEDNWLAYANLFIDTYRLDEKQANAARDRVHKDMKDQAIKYRQKHKAEFEAVETGTKLAGASKMKIQETAAKKVELEKPVREMFMDMDRRLDGLVDSKQRANVNLDKKKLLDRNFETLAGTSRDELAKQKSDGPAPKLRSVAATSQATSPEATTEQPPPPATTAPSK